MKRPVCILEPSVAVEQRVSSRIGSYSLVEGVKNQSVVVGITDNERHDSPVEEVQNGTEIELMLLSFNVILELCYISQPLLVWLGRMEFPIQNICCQILWIGSLTCAAVAAVLNGRLNPFGPANSQHSLIIYRCIMESFQIIPYPPVSLVWVLTMDLLCQIRNTLIFYGSLASVSRLPLVICCPGHPKNPALCIDRIVKFLVTIPNCAVLTFLSYLPQRSLLSNFFTFFRRSRSIFSI